MTTHTPPEAKPSVEILIRPTATIAPFSVYQRTDVGWKLIDDCHNLSTAKSIKDRAEKNAKGRPITVKVYDNRMGVFLNHPSLG